MARRRRSKKQQPVERVLTFTLSEGYNYVDLAQCLSALSRRSFRQGMEYVIQKVEIIGDVDEDVVCSIERFTKGWVSANSWTKGFHHWQQQQDDALSEAGLQSTKAGYSDFKIFFDGDHHDSPNAILPWNCMNATDAAALQVALGEPVSVAYDWQYSEVVVPNEDDVSGDTEEYFLHMIGDDDPASKGLIHNYALSRSRPVAYDPNVVQDPLPPDHTGGLYSEMVDVGQIQEEVVENAMFHNEEPPYLIDNRGSFEWYPGGRYQPLAGLTQEDALMIRGGPSGFSSDSTAPFSAYCGLLKVSNLVAGTSMRITLASGDYHGIMARPMQDVN